MVKTKYGKCSCGETAFDLAILGPDPERPGFYLWGYKCRNCHAVKKTRRA